MKLDFVILGEKDIIANLTDLGHPKEDVVDAVTKLEPDAIQCVYERLLERVCGYTRDSFAPDFRCMRHLRHQEHDDDTIYLLELYRHLRDWMSAIGIPDFGFRDMHEPTKKRLRKHLSAAINFSKFVEWKEEFEQQLDDAADEANARNLQMQAKVEARRLELAEVMEEKQRKAQATEEAMAKLREVEARLQPRKQEFAANLKAIDAHQSSIAHKQQKIKMVSIGVEEAEINIQVLRSRVVESPDKLLSDIEELKESISQKSRLFTDQMNTMYKLGGRTQIVKTITKEIEELSHTITTALVPGEQARKLHEAAYEDIQARWAKVQEEQDAANRRDKERAQSTVAEREASAREKKQRGARRDALLSKLQLMHRETSKNEAAAEILVASANEHLEKVKKLKQTQEQFHAANARKKEPLLSRFQQMEDDFMEYQAALAPLLAQKTCSMAALQGSASLAALSSGMQSMDI